MYLWAQTHCWAPATLLLSVFIIAEEYLWAQTTSLGTNTNVEHKHLQARAMPSSEEAAWRANG